MTTEVMVKTRVVLNRLNITATCEDEYDQGYGTTDGTKKRQK